MDTTPKSFADSKSLLDHAAQEADKATLIAKWARERADKIEGQLAAGMTDDTQAIAFLEGQVRHQRAIAIVNETIVRALDELVRDTELATILDVTGLSS